MKSQYDTIFQRLITSDNSSLTLEVGDINDVNKLRAGLSRAKRAYQDTCAALGLDNTVDKMQFSYTTNTDASPIQVTVSLVPIVKTTFKILN